MPRTIANLHGSALGPAPRAIVCAGCRQPNEVVLGRYVGARKCPRCRKAIVAGVVAQAPAPSCAVSLTNMRGAA